ncbi:MAG TPA: hypothetical protein VF884_06115 [Nitrososphaeraceae archaeon]
MDKHTTVSPEMVSMTKRKPIKLEIVSSPERTSLINTDLHEILSDASSACDFNSYVDADGSTLMKIECLLNQDEKMRAWDLLRFKYGKSCGLTTYPSELMD